MGWRELISIFQAWYIGNFCISKKAAFQKLSVDKSKVENEANKIGCIFEMKCHQLSKIGQRPISTNCIIELRIK